jgi:IrrE N-terminal-like domain
MALATAISPLETANKLLDETWEKDAFGYPAIPVDPVQIARALNIQVFNADLPEGVSAALVGRGEGADPVIFLRKTDSISRKRFSTAHEIGHYMKRLSEGTAEDVFEYVDLRSKSSSEGFDPEEIFANKFANSLLIPRSTASRLAIKDYDLVALARAFDVSPISVSIYLNDKD